MPSTWTPSGWHGRRHWHVLDVGTDQVLNFLSAWQHWQQDVQRPDRLFFTLVTAQALSASDILALGQTDAALAALVKPLSEVWRGLLPGVHRLVLESGQVQLTVCVGAADNMLREIDVVVNDAILMQWPQEQGDALHTFKAIARLCQPGSRLSCYTDKNTRPSHWHTPLQQCGFEILEPPAGSIVQALFKPRWTPRGRLRTALHDEAHRRHALVLGAGLSGSACAFSLVQRGWQVDVLDAGAAPGAGASGLPAGLSAPHVSPDDNMLSRITRAGVRATVQRASQLLQSGLDWAPSGVLEHRVEGKRNLPVGDAWPVEGHEWSTPASAALLMQAGLPNGAHALWHNMGAWIRPRPLAHTQLQASGVQVHWQCLVAQVVRANQDWLALDAQGHVLGRAPILIVAGGYDTRALLQQLSPDTATLPLNPLRGQISMGPLSALTAATQQQLPPFPVNGHGSFITGAPLPCEAPNTTGEAGWYLGSTFERACPQALLRDEDHNANHARLTALLPALSGPMHPAFALDQVRGWAGLRCTLPDRVPAVGELDAERWPGLHVCVGMGARGISLSVLAGELIAAQLEGEPLPLAPSLAQHLAARRFEGRSPPQ